jgi:hypothetical protein
LSDDIAAVLLPPQHDFGFADREGQIESSFASSLPSVLDDRVQLQ